MSLYLYLPLVILNRVGSSILELRRSREENAVKKHTVLKDARLIHSEKQGRFVVYSLRDGVLKEVIEAGVPKETLDLGCCQIVLPLDK